MKGPYHDYMPEWYTDVGLKICQAMVINSVMPYVGVATSIIVPMLIQKLDNGFTDDIYKTKQSSLIKYRALYSSRLSSSTELFTAARTTRSISNTLMLLLLSMSP